MEELQEEFYEGKEMRDELQCEFDEVKKAVVCWDNCSSSSSKWLIGDDTVLWAHA